MQDTKKLTWLCYGAMMSLSIGLNLLPVFLTSLGLSFGGPSGLSQEELGRLGAFAFSGLVIGILITGPMADRWGTKPFALLGNVLIVLSLCGMAWAPTYPILAFMLFLLGLGAGIIDMVLSPIVSALNPERRAVALNWLHSFYCVGAVVTILAGTVALQMGLSWRQATLILIPLPILIILGFAPLPFPDLAPEGDRLELRALMKRRWFIIALVAIFLGGATELGMAQWLPSYAEKALGFPTWVGGTSLLFFSLAMAAGRMVVGLWGAKQDPCIIMAWCCATSVIAFLGASFLPDPHWALAFCIIAGFTGSALWPTLLAVVANHYPNGGASMFGALAAMGNAGGIFMPWIVGGIADHSNLHWGLAVSTLAPLFMFPLVLILRKKF